MQGSREVVGMGIPGVVRRRVDQDTFRARQSFVRVLGNAVEDRIVQDRKEETDHTVATAKVVRAEMEVASASAFSDSASTAINS